MVEDNICRECGSELNPKIKYCPNCKCNVEIEKIDDTPQNEDYKSISKINSKCIMGNYDDYHRQLLHCIIWRMVFSSYWNIGDRIRYS